MWTAETSMSYVLLPWKQAACSHTGKHRTLGPIPERAYSMGRERDRGAGGLAASIAFPVMADFAALDELGHIGGNHHVAAVRAMRGCRKSANTREPGRVEMKLHGLRPPVVVGVFVADGPPPNHAHRVPGHRGEGETL